MTDQGAQYKAARRAAAREHHPDVGGDPETYIRVLAEIDRLYRSDSPRYENVITGYPTWKGRCKRAWFRCIRVPRKFRRRQWVKL
ncbi:hypothetical protein IEU95_10635 [Hoyosella rhizosphaerae]|uniref:J domain-containing protein n=1 Tax=Hoyosella rhizosphaerae TaxID=1755582 RepID=A0A916X928_9ACTN|nr:hypothetical protein [Hoyosella rhizosphaerae]MBN4927291.1 hypothetical protein [Hoyosella rhizosphaerae]GGC52429.1 hypothetical protein GCM10011410_00950 [Hoyosella rhizosphaerae]